MRATDPVVTFLLVLAIGIIVGVLFDRLAGRSWLARQLSGSTRSTITSALVGVAGAFVGYHIALLIVLRAGLLTSVIAAAVGAAAVMFAWRMAKRKYRRVDQRIASRETAPGLILPTPCRAVCRTL